MLVCYAKLRFNIDLSGLEEFPWYCWSWSKVAYLLVLWSGESLFLLVLLKSAGSTQLSFPTLIVLQGRGADSLSQYFGEDPARCPFEQGLIWFSTLMHLIFSCCHTVIYLFIFPVGPAFCPTSIGAPIFRLEYVMEMKILAYFITYNFVNS